MSPECPGNRNARNMMIIARILPTAALAGGLLLTGCVETGAPDQVEIAGDTTSADIPIERIGPGGAALVVPVHLNGAGPWDFVLDTGATLTCVDSALADSLELPDAGGQLGVGMGVGQQPGTMRLVQLDSVRVGDASVTGLSGCAVELGQFREAGVEAHGLLGLNFLTSFRMTLDFEAGSLSLERP